MIINNIFRINSEQKNLKVLSSDLINVKQSNFKFFLVIKKDKIKARL